VGLVVRVLIGLHAPVQRYFRAVLKNGQPIVSAVYENNCWNIASALIDRAPSVIEERRTNHRDVRCRVGLLTLTVDSYPTSEDAFDSSSHVIAQFLRSLQRSLDPDNLHLARCDLSGRFAVTSRSHQTALVAG